MGKKSTTKEFIEKSILTHGNKYDYSVTEYENAKSKVNINCSIHGIFKQTPANHLTGYGCVKCANIIIGEKLRKNSILFIQKVTILHEGYYDYSKVIYKNNETDIEIICPKHGSFFQQPKKHLNRGQGCLKCSKNVSKPEIELQEFIKSLKLDIKTNDRNFLNNGREIDILIPDYKIAIEFNGMYWHYDERNPNRKPKGYHAMKSKICKEKGYILLHLREDLWISKKSQMKKVIIKLIQNGKR
jgi:hypothetical protein